MYVLSSPLGSSQPAASRVSPKRELNHGERLAPKIEFVWQRGRTCIRRRMAPLEPSETTERGQLVSSPARTKQNPSPEGFLFARSPAGARSQTCREV
jgi:hypothetical protein